MVNCRQLYEQHYGKIPEGYEVHHKVPKHAGGQDVIENLEILTKEEHMKAHLKRYEEYDDFRDLCAYYMIGYNFTEAHRISSSNGGKIGGKKVKELGIGIFALNKEERRRNASKAGYIGGKIQAEKGIGFHKYKTNPELHKSWSSKGGLTSGNFQNKKFQSEMGKRGGKKNAGTCWVNDGKRNLKFRPTENKSLDDFLRETPLMKKGRINYKRKK